MNIWFPWNLIKNNISPLVSAVHCVTHFLNFAYHFPLFQQFVWQTCQTRWLRNYCKKASKRKVRFGICVNRTTLVLICSIVKRNSSIALSFNLLIHRLTSQITLPLQSWEVSAIVSLAVGQFLSGAIFTNMDKGHIKFEKKGFHWASGSKSYLQSKDRLSWKD